MLGGWQSGDAATAAARCAAGAAIGGQDRRRRDKEGEEVELGERNLIPEAPAEVDDKLAFVGSAGSRKKDLKYIVVAIFWSVGERGAGSGVRSTRCERQNFGIGQYHHGHVTA